MQQAINTDRELYALKRAEARYERAVTKARGLSVLVYPNGSKTFVVRYATPAGIRRRLPLGDYPALGLAEARLKAAAVRLDVVGGRDPAGEKAAARTEARTGPTISDLAEGYWAAAAIGLHGGRKRPLRAKTLDRQKALYELYVKRPLGGRLYKEFRRPDVRRFMQDFVIEGRLSPSSIASIGDVLRAFFAYALHEDLIEANPTTGLTTPVTPVSRSRRFSDPSLAALLESLRDASGSEAGRMDPQARMGPHMALGLRFLIVTLTRRTETAGAAWPEIDPFAQTWTIPGERTKNRQEHIVPLSRSALEILGEARRLAGATANGFIFPSPFNPAEHLDPHAMTRAVNRLCKRLNLPSGSPHDFRRSGATTLTGEQYAVRRFIVGKVLGHTAHEGAAVTAVYDRNEYLAEKRAALDAWGRHIETLTSGPPQAPRYSSRPRHLRLVNAA